MITKERAMEMINEYLLKPNSIQPEWVELLALCRNLLKEKMEEENEVSKVWRIYKG